MVEKIFTNCFLVKRGSDGKIAEVCLAMKKRGFGAGLWNGSGGKPGIDEPLVEAALREVREELGVAVRDIKKCGEFHFVLKKEEMEATMYAFLAEEWDKDPAETEEMVPKWFRVGEIPFDKMWKSDREFLPKILSDTKVRGFYVFEGEGGKVLESRIEVVEGF